MYTHLSSANFTVRDFFSVLSEKVAVCKNRIQKQSGASGLKQKLTGFLSGGKKYAWT